MLQILPALLPDLLALCAIVAVFTTVYLNDSYAVLIFAAVLVVAVAGFALLIKIGLSLTAK